MMSRSCAVVLCSTLAAIVLLLVSFSPCAAFVKDGDPQTIGWALAQPDNSTVGLTDLQTLWRGRSGASIAVKEWSDKYTPTPRLLLVSKFQLPAKPWWSINVTGTLQTMEGTDRDGTPIKQRVLVVNPSSDVTVFCDWKTGRPYPCINKNFADKYNLWMRPLSDFATDAEKAAVSAELPVPLDEPEPPAQQSMLTLTSGTISWAKSFDDDTTLPLDGRQYALENKPVVWCDGMNVYIEESDRSSGILLSTGSLPPSDSPYNASVSGIIRTNTDGERYIEVTSISYTSTANLPKVIGMNNRSISMGLSPAGLLLKVWGKVTATDATNGYVYVDDGSALQDGTTTGTEQNVGIRVLFSDTYFPAVGNYAVIAGPLGRVYDYNASTSVNCIRTRGLLDVVLSPPPAPTNLGAIGCNATVMLAWNQMNAAEFRVYRSTSQSGQYTLVGTSTGPTYTDTQVTNGVTYWYKVSAVNNEEGPLTTPVSATPTALAPTVSINNASVDSNGLLTLQCSGSSSQAGYTLFVDEDMVWTFSQSEIGNLVYDTTKLPNGPHKFEIQASDGQYQAVASVVLNIQNFISEFNIPDDMSGYQSISAKFQESTNWTLTINQSGSPLYSTSGSGTSMDVSWDAGSTYGEFDVTLSASGRSRTRKSRKNNPSGGSYYAWASIYVADNDPDYENNFRYMHQFASSALQAKYGVSIYSGRLSSDSAWQDVVIDLILNGDIPANHLAIASHGALESQSNHPTKPLWQGLVAGKFPGSSYLYGSGLTPFLNINPILNPPGSGDFIPVGPAIGNTLDWDPSSGDVANWSCTRRLRFVYIGACRAGNGVFSLAFGTPRGRHPGRGRAFLSFKDQIPGGYTQMFSEKFWDEWKKTGVTVAEAATRAFWYVMNQKKYRVNYVLHGDPNLPIK